MRLVRRVVYRKLSEWYGEKHRSSPTLRSVSPKFSLSHPWNSIKTGTQMLCATSMIVAHMPRNVLEVIHSISEDKNFPPSQNLAQIARIAKGFAPTLTTILKDYIEQNTGSGIASRISRIRAAKRMLGAE